MGFIVRTFSTTSQVNLNILERFREISVRRSLALKDEAKKARSAYNDADEIPIPPIEADRES